MTDSPKLTSYFGERQRCGSGFVADALLELYAAAFTVVDELTSESGLVTVEDIPAVARSEPGRERSSFVMKIS